MSVAGLPDSRDLNGVSRLVAITHEISIQAAEINEQPDLPSARRLAAVVLGSGRVVDAQFGVSLREVLLRLAAECVAWVDEHDRATREMA